MSSKASGVKRTSVVLICLASIGVIIIAAGLIAVTTDSGAAWARNLIGDRDASSIQSQDTPSGSLPPSDEAIQNHAGRPRGALEYHMERSREMLKWHTRRIPRPSKEVRGHVERSLETIEDHIDWSQDMLKKHVQRSQERFEDFVGKD